MQVSANSLTRSKRTPSKWLCSWLAAVEEVDAADVVVDLREDLVAVGPEFGREVSAEPGHRLVHERLQVGIEIPIALDIGVIKRRAVLVEVNSLVSAQYDLFHTVR